MDWTLTAQIVAIVAIYLGGILGIGRFVTQSLGKRIDDLKSMTESHLDHLAVARMIQGLDKRIDGLDKRIDGLDKRIDGLDKRIGDLGSNMNERFGDVNNRIGDLDKRIDDLSSNMNERFSEMNANINARVDDLRSQDEP